MATISTAAGEQPVAQRRQSILSNYILGRILKAIITILIVITLTFVIVRLLPGNPVETYIQEQMALYNLSYEQARDQAAAIMSIDLNQPLYLQYFDYLGGLLRGDLGESYRSKGTPV